MQCLTYRNGSTRTSQHTHRRPSELQCVMVVGAGGCVNARPGGLGSKHRPDHMDLQCLGQSAATTLYPYKQLEELSVCRPALGIMPSALFNHGYGLNHAILTLTTTASQ
jgi:hypothetical protein